jgi:hypothetical protein
MLYLLTHQPEPSVLHLYPTRFVDYATGRCVAARYRSYGCYLRRRNVVRGLAVPELPSAKEAPRRRAGANCCARAGLTAVYARMR